MSLTRFLGDLFADAVSYLLKGFQEPTESMLETSNADTFKRTSITTYSCTSEADSLEIEHRRCEEFDEERRQTTDKHRTASAWHIWGLGVTIVMGGQFFSWSLSLTSGVGSFALAMFFVSSAYLCLNMCLAEMSSAVPFAGGSYGYARVAMGMHIGFLAGCCEATEYLGSTAFSVLTLGDMLTALTGWPSMYQPLLWFLIIIPALSLSFLHGKVFDRLYFCFGMLCVAVVVVYCVGTSSQMDFSRYSQWMDDNSLFRGGAPSFLYTLANVPWMFLGIEGVPLMSESVINPKENIPRGILTSNITILVTAFALVFAVVSNPPGIDQLSSVTLFPLNSGWQHLFQTSSVLVGLLSLAPVFCNLCPFIWAWGRIVSSMAGSRLLPPVLARKPNKNSPDVALIACAVLTYPVCLLAWSVSATPTIVLTFVLMTSFISYFCQLLSFTIMRLYYDSLQRKFRNPLGIYGALYAGAVFLVCFVAVLHYVSGYVPLVGLAIFLAMVSSYYHFVARHRQHFSPEEKSEMLIAYVIRAHLRKHKVRRQALKTQLRRSSLGSTNPIFKNRSVVQGGSRNDEPSREIDESPVV